MELLWKKPKCERCRHRSHIFYNRGGIGKVDAWKCDARQQAILNNSYIKRLNNCWYFEKK